MRYGKIRIEDGKIIFTKRVKTYTLPCSEIIWAYRRKEESAEHRGIVHVVCIITRLRKKYRFEMSEEEAQECVKTLLEINPSMAVGYPRGARIPMQGLPNTRDLGGLKTLDGRKILPHRLIRSGDLYHLSFEDRRTLLEECHLTKVIDFRTERERQKKPDTILEGVTYISHPILDETAVGVTREGNFLEELASLKTDMSTFLEKVYRELVTDPYSTDQYAKFFDELLLQEDGAVLYHCSVGKDRVGVGTALLLSALGVPREVIMEDYLRTNEYLKPEAEYVIQLLETRMVVTPQIYSNVQAAFSARKTYLESVFDVIEGQYGTMDVYLKKEMYLSPRLLEQLRCRFLI